MRKIKVITILGTRPEIIRLSRVIAALERHCDHRLIHTGQNYDYELNQIFFDELDIRRPDHFLNVPTNTLGQVLGGILISVEPILIKERPDAVLILGDTNSSVAGIIVKRLKIPLYHMEAGNRCFDLNVPEEINRRLIDHIADFNLVYTEHARRHLISEGLPHRRIYKTGSPMAEVLAYYAPRIDAADVVNRLQLVPDRYFVVSAHREENVDDKINLVKIVEALNHLAATYDLPIILSTHPRTAKRLKSHCGLTLDSRIRDLPPFGFLDYIALQKSAYCTLSDSGTISEEAAILGFPALTIRTATERPEAIDAGTIALTGFDKGVIQSSIEIARSAAAPKQAKAVPEDYQVMNTSERVLKLIVGTSHLSNAWDGIKRYD